MSELKKIIEAVLLVSDSPLSVSRIQKLFTDDAQPSADEINQVLGELQDDCDERGVELRRIGGAYRYQSRAQYAEWIRKLHATRPPRLSRALLETLAIIAYRQPVTRGDIETIRGVAVSTDIMRRLLEREWVKEIGVRDVAGHPTLFATTAEFLSYFGLESLKDLPALPEQRELGEIAGEVSGTMETPFPAELLASFREHVEGDDDDGDDGGDGSDDNEMMTTESESSSQEDDACTR